MLEIWHIFDHINTMIENLFHESDEKLKEGCIELRKILLHWYDDKYADRSDDEDEEKYKSKLPIFRQNCDESKRIL